MEFSVSQSHQSRLFAASGRLKSVAQTVWYVVSGRFCWSIMKLKHNDFLLGSLPDIFAGYIRGTEVEKETIILSIRYGFISGILWKQVHRIRKLTVRFLSWNLGNFSLSSKRRSITHLNWYWANITGSYLWNQLNFGTVCLCMHLRLVYFTWRANNATRWTL